MRPAPVFQLALSGGGYRAMLFHIGSLRRLNDARLLSRLSIVSSVSGGSITAGILAHRWPLLIFDNDGRAENFPDVIERPLRALADQTLDSSSILGGLAPFQSSGELQVKKFDKHLFNGAKLADIVPGGKVTAMQRPRPLFIFNATSLQTGERWQFRARAMGGLQTYWTEPQDISLSEAVAASSGFPPFLSPLKLDLERSGKPRRWFDCSERLDNPFGIDYRNEPVRIIPESQMPKFRKSVHLLDGGLRDNLGVDPLDEINRIRDLRMLEIIRPTTATFISDGGRTYNVEENPSTMWQSQLMRVLDIVADEPDQLRIAKLVRDGNTRINTLLFNTGLPRPPSNCTGETTWTEQVLLETKSGENALQRAHNTYAYWSIRRMPKLHNGYDCPINPRTWMSEEVQSLSGVPTRMKKMERELQERLINWGYVATQHGMPYIDFLWTNDWRAFTLLPCQIPYPDISPTNSKVPVSALDAKCLNAKPEMKNVIPRLDSSVPAPDWFPSLLSK